MGEGRGAQKPDCSGGQQPNPLDGSPGTIVAPKQTLGGCPAAAETQFISSPPGVSGQPPPTHVASPAPQLHSTVRSTQKRSPVKSLRVQTPNAQSESSIQGEQFCPPLLQTPARCEQVGCPRRTSQTSQLAALPQGQLLLPLSQRIVQIRLPPASSAQICPGTPRQSASDSQALQNSRCRHARRARRLPRQMNSPPSPMSSAGTQFGSLFAGRPQAASHGRAAVTSVLQKKPLGHSSSAVQPTSAQ